MTRGWILGIRIGYLFYNNVSNIMIALDLPERFYDHLLRDYGISKVIV